MNSHAFGRIFAISPGVRTIPAAIAFPIATAMPNHTPRTWSRRPRPAAGVELTVEVASDVPDNVRLEGSEKQPSYRGAEQMQGGSSGVFMGKAAKRFFAGVLLLAIWECRGNSICPKRRILGAERSGCGQFS